MSFYNRMQRLSFKYQRYAPKNIMLYIIGGMALVYVSNFMLSLTSAVSLTGLFAFDRAAILHGQVWRLFTFILIPPNSSLLFIVFSLYFYYIIGSALEREWGSFWFDIYYLCGMIGTIIAGFITGGATNYYLNMSLFFAFAVMYPNFEVLIFFILPVKIKWLALLDAALFLVSFILGGWFARAAIIASLINFFIFFGPSFFRGIRESIDTAARRRRFNSQYNKGRRDGENRR